MKNREALLDQVTTFVQLLIERRKHPAHIGVTVDGKWRKISVVALSDEEALMCATVLDCLVKLLAKESES